MIFWHSWCRCRFAPAAGFSTCLVPRRNNKKTGWILRQKCYVGAAGRYCSTELIFLSFAPGFPASSGGFYRKCARITAEYSGFASSRLVKGWKALWRTYVHVKPQYCRLPSLTGQGHTLHTRRSWTRTLHPARS